MADCAPGHEGFRIGDRIRVRRERWQVAAVGGTPACRVLTVTGLGPDNGREQRLLLEPFEIIEPIARQAPGSGGPDLRASLPAYARRCGRRRWRAACCDMVAGSGPWEALRSADGAAIEVLPHQLEPARALLRGDATRVLLADAVGLGKTVQAGILLAELLRRGAADSALVLTPAGLRDQWQHELRQRFGLDADIVDLPAVARRAADLPLGVSPWTTLGLAIASVDYVKRPEVLPSTRAGLWDVVIVDEAHLVAPGTDRHAAVSALCATALFVVLLTATPHNGDRDAFAALCALGRHDDECLRFQRSRADVHLQTNRHVHQLRIRTTGAEQRMYAALDRYAAATRAERGDEPHAILLRSVLWKRALSSAESLRRSVVRRLATLERTAPFDDTQLRLPLDDGQGEFDVSDEAPPLDGPGLRDVERERDLLQRLADAAVLACARESKLARLTRLLGCLRQRHEAVIVFTEYRDTLAHVQRLVAPDALVLHGGLTRGERRAVVDAFTRGGAPILLATDAAGEGLNLHHACRCVIHLELPWNPARLEQRTGRVDRIGQGRTVHAFHLVARHRVEDDLLRRLRHRVATARQDVAMANPLESQLHRARGIGRDNAPASAGSDRTPTDADGAAAEAARIALSRRVAGRGRRAAGVVQHDRLLVMRARPRLRAGLAGDTLLVAEVVAVDGCGRRVAAAIVPLRLSADVWSAVRSAGPGIDRPAMAAIGEHLAAMQPSLAAHRTFWSTALRRAEAIARATTPAIAALFQPGLFDRRADRRRDLLDAEWQSLAAANDRRLARLASAAVDTSVTAGRWLAAVP